MHFGCCPGRTIAKIGYFALIGLLAILLAGPVLGLLSILLSIVLAIFSIALTIFVVILPFAVLGFVIMAPIQAATSGRPVEWRRLGVMCKNLWRGSLGAALWCWRKLHQFVHLLRRKVAALSIYVRVVFWEVVCGAFVGGFLGGMVALHDPDKPEIIIGAALGAILGALVGASRVDVKDATFNSPAETV
ncbi:MAG TPA: hypothetical protein VGX70_00480 [Gemmataceae bacterium]|jgi:hypothetical protein|nr:hypothetical protein [Gemmataceae bacterium]